MAAAFTVAFCSFSITNTGPSRPWRQQQGTLRMRSRELSFLAWLPSIYREKLGLVASGQGVAIKKLIRSTEMKEFLLKKKSSETFIKGAKFIKI